MTQPGLHVVDLACFMEAEPTCYGDREPDVKNKVAHELVRALHNTGFAYIRNHGLPQNELDEAFAMSKQFFDLPMEDKMKAPHPPGWQVHRGYSHPGLEKVSNITSDGEDYAAQAKSLRQVEDFKESFEIGAEEFKDMPNVWPPENLIPQWKPFMSEFYWKCFRIAINILKAIATGLEVSEETLMAPHTGLNGQLRLLHYPPVSPQQVEGGKIARMPAHSDWSTITLLFQEPDDGGGLQIESPTKPGTFIDASPPPGTLILNVGDLLMRWSNDYLKSTQHRVILPSQLDHSSGPKKLSQTRYSIPFFLSPDPDVIIKCLDTGKGPAAKYEPITQRDYAAMRARMQY